jgi:hypothetical protein
MCFVFIWEQTVTCATYSINWLVFITEMKSVYSAVRTGSLNKAVCASSLKGQRRSRLVKADISNFPAAVMTTAGAAFALLRLPFSGQILTEGASPCLPQRASRLLRKADICKQQTILYSKHRTFFVLESIKEHTHTVPNKLGINRKSTVLHISAVHKISAVCTVVSRILINTPMTVSLIPEIPDITINWHSMYIWIALSEQRPWTLTVVYFCNCPQI